MANLKDIKRRIGSVKNTRKITAAMKLVAAAKVRKAQENVLASRPYQEKLFQVLSSLAERVGDDVHPLLEKRKVKNVLIIVFSSDKGLCGGFNANLFKGVQSLIHENEGKGIFLSTVGRKAKDFYSNSNAILHKTYVDFSRHIDYPFAQQVGRDAIEAFISGQIDEVYTAYNKFNSILSQEVIVSKVLPLSSQAAEEPVIEESAIDYLYEPSSKAILDEIIEKFMQVGIYQALLESWASENGARMAAMDSATRNAGDMISKLTLQYNRARQAAITTEIIEIVSGAQALEG